MKTLEKYYVVDPGIRRHLLFGRSQDVGHVLENVVFLELLRHRYKVRIGMVGSLEVDFVAENSDGTEYYQVAATVRETETLRCELGPLQKNHDHYPKFLLTLDEDPSDDFDGIRKLNALDWLLR